MKKILILMLTLGLAATVVICVSGCNTVRGAGRDIQRGGQAIQNLAD